MNSHGAHVVCGGLTFDEVPVELREKVAFRDAQLPDALREIKRMLGLREAVLVSTCNRVEYFGATTDPEQAAHAWPEFLRHFHSVTDNFAALSFQMRDIACVEHLYAVLVTVMALGWLSHKKTALLSVAGYVFILLTFWGINSLSEAHVFQHVS